MPTEEDLKAIVVHKNVRRGEDKKRRKRKRTPSYSSHSSASRSPSSGSDKEDKKDRKELIKSLPPIPGGGDIGFIPSRFLKRDTTRNRSSEKRDSRDTRRGSEKGDNLVSYPGYSSQSSHTAKPSEEDRFKKREGDRRDSDRARRDDDRREEGRSRGLAEDRREERREDDRRDDRRGDERRDEDRRGDRRDDRRDDDRKDDRRGEERRGADERSEYRKDKRLEEERRGDDRRDDRERNRSVRKDSVEREEESKYRSSQSSAARSDQRPADRGDRGGDRGADRGGDRGSDRGGDRGGDRGSYRDSPQYESSFRRSMRESDRGKYHEKEGRDRDVRDERRRETSHSKRDEDDEEYDAISDEELAMLEDESGLADIFRELEREMRAKRYKAVLDHIDFSALEPLAATQGTAKDPATLLSKCGYSSTYGGKALTERVKELFVQRGQEAPLKGAYSANPVSVQSILKDTLSPTLALSAYNDARLRQRLDALNTNKHIVPDLLPMERTVNNSLLQDSVRLFNSLAGTNLEVK